MSTGRDTLLEALTNDTLERIIGGEWKPGTLRAAIQIAWQGSFYPPYQPPPPPVPIVPPIGPLF